MYTSSRPQLQGEGTGFNIGFALILISFVSKFCTTMRLISRFMHGCMGTKCAWVHDKTIQAIYNGIHTYIDPMMVYILMSVYDCHIGSGLKGASGGVGMIGAQLERGLEVWKNGQIDH